LLHGNRDGQWECHIQAHWLLIWEQNNTELTLLMMNTGTHADLFGKTKR
jgi:addiction module toxin, relE/stbE family